ncbi:hypothetical protein Peur_016196 [Populus x canadensis]
MVMLIRVGEFERCCFEGRKEEQEEFANGFTPLLGLSSSLSSLCSAAEYLFQIVHGALPQLCFDLIHLCHLLKSLFLSWTIFTRNWIKCLVQGGEVEEFSCYSICLWGVCYRIFNVLILDILKELLMILMKR